MTDRDQVFAEFALRQFVHGWSADAEHWQVNAMVDEIIRLRAILAELTATAQATGQYDLPTEPPHDLHDREASA